MRPKIYKRNHVIPHLHWAAWIFLNGTKMATLWLKPALNADLSNVIHEASLFRGLGQNGTLHFFGNRVHFWVYVIFEFALTPLPCIMVLPLIDWTLHWEKKWSQNGSLREPFWKMVPFLKGEHQNSSTRGAELRTSKQLPKGSYFGSLFFLSVVYGHITWKRQKRLCLHGSNKRHKNIISFPNTDTLTNWKNVLPSRQNPDLI